MRGALRVVTMSMLVLSLGLHWAFLQTVAWAGMLVTYSREASIAEAVAKTFDGEHPCALCKVIKKGRTEERNQEQQQVKPEFKLDLSLIWQASVFEITGARILIPSPQLVGLYRTDEPPKPPPRGSLDNRARA